MRQRWIVAASSKIEKNQRMLYLNFVLLRDGCVDQSGVLVFAQNLQQSFVEGVNVRYEEISHP